MLSRTTAISHVVVLFATIYVSKTYAHSSLFAYPTQSANLILAVSGLSVFLLSTVSTRPLFSSDDSSITSTLPLQDFHLKPLDETPARERLVTPILGARHHRLLILSTSLAICFRVEIFRQISINGQCRISSLEGLVPAILAFYGFLYSERGVSESESSDDLATSLVPAVGHGRYLLPAFLLGIASLLQAHISDPPRSTYICPVSSFAHTFTPTLQFLAVLLDCFVISAVQRAVIDAKAKQASQSLSTPSVLSNIFLLSSALLCMEGILALATNSVYWVEISHLRRAYLVSVIGYSTLLVTTATASVQIVLDYGLPYLAISVLLISIFSAGFHTAPTTVQSITAPTRTATASFFIFLTLGSILYVRAESRAGLRSRLFSQSQGSRESAFKYAMIAVAILSLGLTQIQQPRPAFSSHPIEKLMNEASAQAKNWVAQASRSQTLAEGVGEYVHRYQRYPPPGFDAWYLYATNRSSLVIDDFDSMMEDLQPFWGITPAQIRRRTQDVISDPWNEVSEIRVRNGHADLGPNFLPTHRWMLDGVLDMVKDFAQFLPDMDLGFNLNDEPRVAVPYQDMKKLLSVEAVGEDVQHKWSPDRAKAWETPEDQPPLRLFEDHSRTNAFDEGSIACPPDSFAQKAHLWDTSALCLSCAAPHSDGVFVSNWTLSASPCHQPDLRHLHGFYLSPAAFKPSHQLLPIFSQSKTEGYADILYPSPWNYVNKISYDPDPENHPDPPLTEKVSSLFWRGATSEGVSRAGTWKGMTRQRFVHLTNNLTTASRSPLLPLLLPDPSLPGEFSYQTLSDDTPISALSLNLDVSIVNGIARAWDNDGAAQDAEFGFAPPTDFQSHWRYRYLFDMDGAGFSGRFLPFLRSHSLPFRTGIFRSWWDSRLTAWTHFVPVDVRLHGLFSTLAFFMGVNGSSSVGGSSSSMPENLKAGQEIAEAGRMWAEKALRKEDMEIFMFRLLLEWGRLTDDARDSIGFMG